MLAYIASIPRYEVLLMNLIVYGLALGARIMGFGFHTNILDRKISGARNEIWRIGSDCALVAVGVFLGASAIKESLFYKYSTSSFRVSYTLALFSFLGVFSINYVLFLFLKDKEPSEIFLDWKLSLVYVLTIVIGWTVLWGAGILAAPVMDAI